MIVEDGTGVAGANAAITEAFYEAYAELTGRTLIGDAEVSIVRGTAAIGALYGSRFPGSQTFGRAQGLPWPRTGATDRECRAIGPNEMPVEYLNAVAEAALREDALPGSMLPDVANGGAVKSLREEVGSLKTQTDYAVSDGAHAPGPRFPLIDGILAPLLRYGVAQVAILRV